MALNTISLSGRLTADPELRYTTTDKPVANFTLAVDRNGVDAGTDFINCVVWNSTALFVDKYFSKGSSAIVTGRLQIRNYEDRNGVKRTAAEVVVSNIYFAGDKKKTDTPAQNYTEPGQFETLPDDDSDLPF